MRQLNNLKLLLTISALFFIAVVILAVATELWVILSIGVGSVLGGGCISGCMYKGATGNINSIAALLTIPIGISFADFGPLEGFNKFLLSFVINGENDNAITLHSLLGLPYWLLVLMFFLLTIVLTNINSTITYIQTKSAQIPSVAVPKYEPKKLSVWLILLSIGTIIGAFISGLMSGQTKLLPKEPSQILIAALGGFLIGVGAGIATGCIIGNILSAWAMFSVGMLILGVATLLANWATAYFYLMGGKLFNK